MRLIQTLLCACLLTAGLASTLTAQEVATAPAAAAALAVPPAAAGPSAAPPPAAPTTSAGVPLTRADVEAWLDGYLPYALDNGDIAGAVVAVVKDGQVLLQKGYGYSDTEKRTPVDPDSTLFRPGSVSKLFT